MLCQQPIGMFHVDGLLGEAFGPLEDGRFTGLGRVGNERNL